MVKTFKVKIQGTEFILLWRDNYLKYKGEAIDFDQFCERLGINKKYSLEYFFYPDKLQPVHLYFSDLLGDEKTAKDIILKNIKKKYNNFEKYNGLSEITLNYLIKFKNEIDILDYNNFILKNLVHLDVVLELHEFDFGTKIYKNIRINTSEIKRYQEWFNENFKAVKTFWLDGDGERYAFMYDTKLKSPFITEFTKFVSHIENTFDVKFEE